MSAFFIWCCWSSIVSGYWLYFNEANTTENHKSIMGYSQVSPRTFGALLANTFILGQGILYIDRLRQIWAACTYWAGSFEGARYRLYAFVCACLFECVQGESHSGGGGDGGGGQLFIFHSWHISLGGSWCCSKKPCVSVMWPAEHNCQPLGSKWKQHLAISQQERLKQDRKTPPLPFARNVPALPQPALFTRNSSSWQSNSGYDCVCVCVYICRHGLCWSLQIYQSLIMLQCGVTSPLFALSKL